MLPFKHADIRFNDGFVPLDGSRHMQEPDVEVEIDKARRCETGHLSYAQVVEDYPYEPINSFYVADLIVRNPVTPWTPPPSEELGMGERTSGCDLETGEAMDWFHGKIFIDADPPRMPEFGE